MTGIEQQKSDREREEQRAAEMAEARYLAHLRERAQEEPAERERLEVDARDLKW